MGPVRVVVGDENSSAEGDVASGIRRLHLFMFPGTIKCKAAAATQQGRERGTGESGGNAEVAYRRDERIVGEREGEGGGDMFRSDNRARQEKYSGEAVQ